MAAAATSSSIFPLFSSLPPELRYQIWRNALPDKVRPALYFYRKGCWSPRRLSKSDEGHDPENSTNNLSFEFRHDLLDHHQLEIPLVLVNREARGIALAWVREQGIEMLPTADRQDTVFVRPFDPRSDALYITLDRWDEFLCEPVDRLLQPDLYDQLVSIRPNLTRIAVPEALLRNEVAGLPGILFYFYHLEVLFILVGAQPHLQPAPDNDVTVQRRWEFENTPGGAFIWNSDRGGFDAGDTESIGDEALYRLIEEASKGLGEEIAQEGIRSFEIRPVFTVTR